MGSGLLLALGWVQMSSLGKPLENPLSAMIPISPSDTRSPEDNRPSLCEALPIVTTELSQAAFH